MILLGRVERGGGRLIRERSISGLILGGTRCMRWAVKLLFTQNNDSYYPWFCMGCFLCGLWVIQIKNTPFSMFQEGRKLENFRMGQGQYN